MPIKAISRDAHHIEVLKETRSGQRPSVADEAKRTMSGVFELAIAASPRQQRSRTPRSKSIARKPKRSTSERSRQRKLVTFLRR